MDVLEIKHITFIVYYTYVVTYISKVSILFYDK